MQLDKRVGEYAVAIVRDVDLLLEDTSNFSDKQMKYKSVLKRYADLFLSFYNQHTADFDEITTESRSYAHAIRASLNFIGGYSDWLLENNTSATPTQLQLLQQIKASHDAISNAFVAWVTQYMSPLE